MFQPKTTQEFQCEYCPKSFSKRSSLRNHLRTHRDQMYLDETGLSREENVTISSPSRESNSPFMNNEQDLMLEDNYWQVKDSEVCSNEVS